MMSLKTYITAGYGASIYKETITYKDLMLQQAKSKNQQVFLQRCISNKIIPKSFRIHNPLKSDRSRQLQRKYSFDLITCAKNEVRKKYFRTTDKIRTLENELRTILSEDDMCTIQSVTKKAREKTFTSIREKLKSKFTGLTDRRQQHALQTTRLVKSVVINLSQDELTQNQESLLNLGPKFVPAPTKVPVMDIITTTEVQASNLDYNNKNTVAQTLRQDVMKALKTAKPPKNNLTKEQRQALKELKSNDTNAIYPFDKGSGLVLIPKEQAIEKLREQIGDSRIVEKDPTDAFARKIQAEVRKVKTKLTKTQYRDIYPSDPIAPRMYGAIKAHKPEKNYPMRIIVSTIGTANHGLSKFLVDLIQPTLNDNDTRLLNSRKFVATASEWDVDPSEVQVSYDVVNLYPSIPIEAACKVVLDMLSNDEEFQSRRSLSILQVDALIKLCLSKCYFVWDNEIHMLENSGPIGLSLMVVMAEAFLQHHEKHAIEIATTQTPPIHLKSFLRYVDDSHARFDSDEQADKFLEILNTQDESIKYTIERESDEGLNFLDVNIKNNGQGKYEFAIHRKNAITNVQIKPSSCHDPKVLKGVFKGFIDRAFNICSQQHVEQELEFLVNVFAENGYSKLMLMDIVKRFRAERGNNQASGEQTVNDSDQQKVVKLPWIPELSLKLKRAFKKAGVKAVFKSSSNLNTILTAPNKNKLAKNSLPGVYEVQCGCGTTYVGETKLKVATRIEQHRKKAFEGKKGHSGITDHAINCTDDVLWDQANTIKTEARYFYRKTREALEIQRRNLVREGSNQDYGQYLNNQFWLPIMSLTSNGNHTPM